MSPEESIELRKKLAAQAKERADALTPDDGELLAVPPQTGKFWRLTLETHERAGVSGRRVCQWPDCRFRLDDYRYADIEPVRHGGTCPLRLLRDHRMPK